MSQDWITNVWISQQNRLMYFKMMNDAGPEPVIHNDWPDKLLVDFFGPVMDKWIEAGYWYEIEKDPWYVRVVKMIRKATIG